MPVKKPMTVPEPPGWPTGKVPPPAAVPDVPKELTLAERLQQKAKELKPVDNEAKSPVPIRPKPIDLPNAKKSTLAGLATMVSFHLNQARKTNLKKKTLATAKQKSSDATENTENSESSSDSSSSSGDDSDT